MAIRSTLCLLFSATFSVATGARLDMRQTVSTIPSFVTEFAPLVYLDVNERYLPGDIGQQISNTYPEVNFTKITSNVSLDLNDLSTLNSFDSAGCTIDNFGSECDIYLTSRENVTSDPPWLYGILPDPSTGETAGAISSATIVNDHGDGTVDAYYFYFYPFNLGLPFGQIYLGNHVGDWEHTMLRFVDEKPSTIWLSAHDGGFVYTYDAISKNGSRPLVYASIGGHANYAVPGLQSRKYGVLVLNDTTSEGPLWDPIASSYFYTYVPDDSAAYNGTFTPAISTGSCQMRSPVDWLHFLGRWGDKQYPDGYSGQIDAGGVSYAYEDGPTGPIDKNLNRNGTCPDATCTTTATLPVPSGTTMPVETVTRTYASTTACSSSGVTQSASAISGSAASGTGSVTSKASGGITSTSITSQPAAFTSNASPKLPSFAWVGCFGVAAALYAQ